MEYNNKFTLKNLFMNQELQGIFPQFTKKESAQNSISIDFIKNKVGQYIKSALNGRIENGDIVITGNFKRKFNEISAMKSVIEDMINNMSNINVGLRKNSKLITPFMSTDQLKKMNSFEQKMKAIQMVLENIKYNPDFVQESKDVFKDMSFYKQQEKWLNKVNYNKFRRS